MLYIEHMGYRQKVSCVMLMFLATRLLWDGLSQLVGARSRSVFLNLLFGKQLENGKFTTRDLVI